MAGLDERFHPHEIFIQAGLRTDTKVNGHIESFIVNSTSSERISQIQRHVDELREKVRRLSE